MFESEVDIDSQLPHCQPSRRTSINGSLTLITRRSLPSPCESSGSSGLLSASCLDSLLGACNKCGAFLHHNHVSVDWLYCTQVSKPKFVWFRDTAEGQEEKGATEGEMAEWHHRLNGLESEQAPGDGEGQGRLACFSPWGRRESDTPEKLNNNKKAGDGS